MSRTVRRQVESTYLRLRTAAAFIGFAFPLVLWIGGLCAGFGLCDSMSAYYHANPHSQERCQTACRDLTPLQNEAIPQAGTMRNAFVGLLFAIGIILFVNKGYSRHEDILLSFAGAFAWCIAIFPMPWKCKPSCPISMHGASAILFFACIVIIIVFCSEDTVKYLPTSKMKKCFRICYWILAGCMGLSPLTAYLMNESIPGHNSYIFWVEFVGIYAFGVYWLVKTKEISILIHEREKQKIHRTHRHARNMNAGRLVIPVNMLL